MMKKALILSLGVSVAAAQVAAASGRSRTPGDGAEPAAGREHEATVLQGSADPGDSIQWAADGSVFLADIESGYGSAERMFFEASVAGVPAIKLEDGTTMFADGSVGYFADLAGSEMTANVKRPASVEALKASVAWVEIEVEGQAMTMFADGTVLTDGSVAASLPPWLEHRESTPHAVIDGQLLYADGAVFFDEPGQTIGR